MRKPPTAKCVVAGFCCQCGLPFVAARKTRRFCSRKCKEKASAQQPERKAKSVLRHAVWAVDKQDHLRDYRSSRYQSNRDEILAKQREYVMSLPPSLLKDRRKMSTAKFEPKRRAKYQKTRQTTPWLNALKGAKARAKKLGLPFDLTSAWCVERWTGRCEVTNIPFFMSTQRCPYLFSPSLDRIVANNGYVVSNCRFVLHAVNALKGAGTDCDMLLIATAIVDKNS